MKKAMTNPFAKTFRKASGSRSKGLTKHKYYIWSYHHQGNYRLASRVYQDYESNGGRMSYESIAKGARRKS